MIEVREVKTKKEIRDFINFPLKLYKGNPYFVPCFYSDEVALFKPNYLYSDQADYRCFIAYEGKKVVGRVVGILQKVSNEKKKNVYADKLAATYILESYLNSIK